MLTLMKVQRMLFSEPWYSVVENYELYFYSVYTGKGEVRIFNEVFVLKNTQGQMP